MATSDTNSHSPYPQRQTRSPGRVTRDRGIIDRWRTRSADRRLARLLTPRSRGALARALRHTANAAGRNRRGLDAALTARWCWSPVLHYRTAAVRTELLEIAALLVRASDPDPACVKEIHELLANGDSPLYHRSVHVSELYATLYYLRAGLEHEHASSTASRPHTTTPQTPTQLAPDQGLPANCLHAR